MKADSSLISFSIDNDASQLLLRLRVLVGVLVGVVSEGLVPPIRTPAERTVNKQRNELDGNSDWTLSKSEIAGTENENS